MNEIQSILLSALSEFFIIWAGVLASIPFVAKQISSTRNKIMLLILAIFIVLFLVIAVLLRTIVR